MSANLMPSISLQFIGPTGIPLAYGKVYTAQAGTTAGPGQSYPLATYTDSTEVSQNTNPLVLDATGSATIWVDGYYSIAVYDSMGTLVRAVNNVSGTANNAAAIQEALYTSAHAAGTSDAITASFTPAVTSTTFTSGAVQLFIRATAANATATPTFTPNYGGITAATIVKGNNLPLALGDIAGAGYWMQLQWDASFNSWVLLNPATGVTNNSVTLQEALYTSAVASGTSDALTATFSPAITSTTFSMGNLSLSVRAISANATTTPTLNVGYGGAITIVKGNNLPLVAGDIAGAGHWLNLTFDATLGKWVLLNPATGVTPLQFASTAQAQAQTDTSHVLNPALLALALQGSNQSTGSGGYQKLPGGIIIQWGTTGAITSGSNSTVTFPIAFPVGVLQAVVSLSAGGNLSQAYTAGAGNYSTTQMVVFAYGGSGAAYNWIAIGH